MYTLTISGDRDIRAKLAGEIITNSAGLTTTFVSVVEKVVFHFDYRSNARMLLRRIAKINNCKPSSCDLLKVENATLTIKKAN